MIKKYEIQVVGVDTNWNEFIIKSAEDVDLFVRGLYGKTIPVMESMYLIFLNRKNEVVGYCLLASGAVDGVALDRRIICKYACDVLCGGVVMVHNHPSGNIEPSGLDLLITDQVGECLEVFGIDLIDHLIITDKTYYSFREEDILPDNKFMTNGKVEVV